jgi:hypothetical protein
MPYEYRKRALRAASENQHAPDAPHGEEIVKRLGTEATKRSHIHVDERGAILAGAVNAGSIIP